MTKKTDQFIIKIGEWYYFKHNQTLSRDLAFATSFAHPEVAKQEIIDEKLKDARVIQVNHTELEVL